MQEPFSCARTISIHAPTRGATIVRTDSDSPVQRFQSTLPRGERHGSAADSGGASVISIHAPTRGATFVLHPFNDPKIFQSTLPRGERPKRSMRSLCHLSISIHAPTRGATILAYFLGGQNEISIHAPTRGATTYSQTVSKW